MRRTHHNDHEYAPTLAQAGGGLWGIAHVGVLKFLAEKNIPLRAIAGVSMGALVGAISSTYVREDGTIDPAGIEYMEKVVRGIRTYEDFVKQESGKTRIAIRELLKQADKIEYVLMMRRGPTVPYMAQVACRFPDGSRQKEVFEYAHPGTNMDDVLQMAEASAANRQMFGIDPVVKGNIEYSDDISVALRSISACTRTLRERFEGSAVIGTALAFKDSSKIVRGIIDTLRPRYKDCGDVVIAPKEGHQLQNGFNSITNWRKGLPLPFLGNSYARNERDLDAGKRIAIPVNDFMQAGYEAAVRREDELLSLIETN